MKDAIKLNAHFEQSNKLVQDIPEELLNCRHFEGFIARAFVLTFFFLLRFEKYQELGMESQFYNDCMYMTVREGGDTDTNAAIVGGVAGAVTGLKVMPELAKRRLVEFDCTDTA